MTPSEEFVRLIYVLLLGHGLMMWNNLFVFRMEINL